MGCTHALGPSPTCEGPNGEESETTLHPGMAMRQKSMQMELLLEGRGEAPREERSGEAIRAVQGDERSGIGDLMERVVERENCLRALKRVRKNKGSPGIDGMRVEDLSEYLQENWERIRAELLAGSYRPSAVRRHEIPKSGGGVRQLGIPTVLDRFIQQAMLQVLQPIFDPTFSEHSYGFRPGRSAHQAVCQAQRYVQSGRRWVVDVDLEKFFDRVNHDVLMGTAGEEGGGQTAAQDHPPLPGGRHHGQRRGGGEARGNAAGRTFVAALGERATRRSGSDAGAERTPLRALCR
jgi:hypothetical protein